MQRLRTVAALRRAVAAFRARGERVAFVPTMGALHAGHLSLVAHARRSADRVVASIFVNPLQFGPREDFRRYPRPIARDRAALVKAGVEVLWEPGERDVYPSGDCTRVVVHGLTRVLEGASRPGHLEGVTTVVLRLLNAVQPDELWLGQKDVQQCVVIERMCRDLLVPVTVKRAPIVRERDGLAMSSRNAYLDAAQREQAAALARGIDAAAAKLRAGERSAARLVAAIRGVWRNYRLVREDYVAVVDPTTLAPLRRVGSRALIAVAARVGKARLIDNYEWRSR